MRNDDDSREPGFVPYVVREPEGFSFLCQFGRKRRQDLLCDETR
jgi:hypothetical protein